MSIRKDDTVLKGLFGAEVAMCTAKSAAPRRRTTFDLRLSLNPPTNVPEKVLCRLRKLERDIAFQVNMVV